MQRRHFLWRNADPISRVRSPWLQNRSTAEPQNGSSTNLSSLRVASFMRAFEVQEFGIENLSLVDREMPRPSDGEVLVRLTAASLNYRDYMVVTGVYNPKLKRPMVPLSDGAGLVEGTGPGVSRFKKGDRVAACFMQKWIDGRVTRENGASALGGSIDGVLREFAVFSEQ